MLQEVPLSSSNSLNSTITPTNAEHYYIVVPNTGNPLKLAQYRNAIPNATCISKSMFHVLQKAAAFEETGSQVRNLNQKAEQISENDTHLLIEFLSIEGWISQEFAAELLFIMKYGGVQPLDRNPKVEEDGSRQFFKWDKQAFDQNLPDSIKDLYIEAERFLEAYPETHIYEIDVERAFYLVLTEAQNNGLSNVSSILKNTTFILPTDDATTCIKIESNPQSGITFDTTKITVGDLKKYINELPHSETSTIKKLLHVMNEVETAHRMSRGEDFAVSDFEHIELLGVDAGKYLEKLDLDVFFSALHEIGVCQTYFSWRNEENRPISDSEKEGRIMHIKNGIRPPSLSSFFSTESSLGTIVKRIETKFKTEEDAYTFWCIQSDDGGIIQELRNGTKDHLSEEKFSAAMIEIAELILSPYVNSLEEESENYLPTEIKIKLSDFKNQTEQGSVLVELLNLIPADNPLFDKEFTINLPINDPTKRISLSQLKEVIQSVSVLFQPTLSKHVPYYRVNYETDTALSINDLHAIIPGKPVQPSYLLSFQDCIEKIKRNPYCRISDLKHSVIPGTNVICPLSDNDATFSGRLSAIASRQNVLNASVDTNNSLPFPVRKTGIDVLLIVPDDYNQENIEKLKLPIENIEYSPRATIMTYSEVAKNYSLTRAYGIRVFIEDPATELDEERYRKSLYALNHFAFASQIDGTLNSAYDNRTVSFVYSRRDNENSEAHKLIKTFSDFIITNKIADPIVQFVESDSEASLVTSISQLINDSSYRFQGYTGVHNKTSCQLLNTDDEPNIDSTSTQNDNSVQVLELAHCGSSSPIIEQHKTAQVFRVFNSLLQTFQLKGSERAYTLTQNQSFEFLKQFGFEISDLNGCLLRPVPCDDEFSPKSLDEVTIRDDFYIIGKYRFTIPHFNSQLQEWYHQNSSDPTTLISDLKGYESDLIIDSFVRDELRRQAKEKIPRRNDENITRITNNERPFIELVAFKYRELILNSDGAGGNPPGTQFNLMGAFGASTTYPAIINVQGEDVLHMVCSTGATTPTLSILEGNVSRPSPGRYIHSTGDITSRTESIIDGREVMLIYEGKHGTAFEGVYFKGPVYLLSSPEDSVHRYILETREKLGLLTVVISPDDLADPQNKLQTVLKSELLYRTKKTYLDPIMLERYQHPIIQICRKDDLSSISLQMKQKN
jgi:hypothetical protein